CSHGEAPAGRSSSAWKRCRVSPPTIRGRAFLFGKKRPALVTQVSLKRPPDKPGALTQTVKLRVPKSLRLRRPGALGKSVQAKILPFWRPGSLDVAVKARTITVSFVREVDESNPTLEDQLGNRELTFSVKIKRGAFRPVRGNLRK